MAQNAKRQAKRQYYINSAKKAKNDNREVAANLTENLRGFFVTCNNNEFRTLKEVYNVLNEAADRLYGPYQVSGAQTRESDDCSITANDHNNECDADDIESSIAAEIAALKSSTSRRFIQAKTKCNNVLFVRSNDSAVIPDDLVREIFRTTRETGRSNCRFIQRFLPVCGTFKATEPDKLEASFREIFARHASKAVQTFSVIAKIRNNSGFKSETALKQKVVEVIRAERPNWSLNYNENTVMVLINIVQRAACVSICENFNENSKYNLVEFGEAVSKRSKMDQEKVEPVSTSSEKLEEEADDKSQTNETQPTNVQTDIEENHRKEPEIDRGNETESKKTD